VEDYESDKMSETKKPAVLFIEEVSGIGGSTVCLYKLMKQLSAGKYKKVIIKYNDDTSYDKDHIQDAAKYRLNHWLGSHISSVKRKHSSRLTSLYVKSLLMIDYLHRITATCIIILRERIDLVHVNNSLAINFPSIIAAKVLGVPVVSHLRSFEEVYPLQRMAYKHVNKSIAITKSVERFYHDRFADHGKIEMIYDGIDEHEIEVTNPDCLRREYGIYGSGIVTVGIAAIFMNWKGIDVFIRAMKIVKDVCPQVRGFVVGDCLAGDSEYKEFLFELSRELNVGDVVHFTGFRKDVYDVFSSLDVVVHASTSPEPFGRVIIEAMALGRPVIATALGGPLEIIKHGHNGFLIEPGDPAALAEAIITLAADEKERTRIGRNASAHVNEHFRQEDAVRKIEAIYDELMAAQR
jgi:glycosyltransferase involved in cell wall biosynthesis